MAEPWQVSTWEGSPLPQRMALLRGKAPSKVSLTLLHYLTISVKYYPGCLGNNFVRIRKWCCLFNMNGGHY